MFRYRLRTLLVVLAIVPPVIAGDGHLGTDSMPRLRIDSVLIPDNPSEELKVTFKLSAEGKTHIALSQEQFSIHINTEGGLWTFALLGVAS